MKVVGDNAQESSDALAALQEVQVLLSAHPGFELVPVKVSARRMPLLGLAIRSLRFRKFGARFEGGLTLMDFRLRWETPRALVLDLQWHVTRLGEGLSVFIHFVDVADEIRFQADYPLESEVPDVLGFFYSRRRVEIPKDAPAGMYRVRLGVWSPIEKSHLKLRRFHGCRRDPAAWCQNAVILDSIEVEENRTT